MLATYVCNHCSGKVIYKTLFLTFGFKTKIQQGKLIFSQSHSKLNFNDNTNASKVNHKPKSDSIVINYYS